MHLRMALNPPGGCGIRARPHGRGRTWLLIFPFEALGLTLGLWPGESLPAWAWAQAPLWWVRGLCGWFYPAVLQLCRETVYTAWAPGHGPCDFGQAASPLSLSLPICRIGLKSHPALRVRHRALDACEPRVSVYVPPVSSGSCPQRPSEAVGTGVSSPLDS